LQGITTNKGAAITTGTTTTTGTNMYTQNNTNPPIVSFAENVRHSLQNYFVHLGGVEPSNVYSMVLAQMEVPVLEMVMQYTKGNQSRAAKILGLSRGTLRKKLAIYAIGSGRTRTTTATTDAIAEATTE